MTSLAVGLAEWAHSLRPSADDLELADRALLDTVAVTLAARDHRVAKLAAGLPEGARWAAAGLPEGARWAAAGLPEGARWAAAGHVLDFDDLHMQSTAHISAVCVPTALATGGGAGAYLAAAGVMARLGIALGWAHYSAGWHATCTAGAPASAAGAAVALGLTAEQIATAIALAVPGAGGVQRAFGTDAKSLQVGFAVDAGIRAARLAAAGARADPSALDAWLSLVGGNPAAAELPLADADPAAAELPLADAGRTDLAHRTDLTQLTDLTHLTDPAVPGGLAVKMYPCCYALQRPISALAELAAGTLDPGEVSRIVLRTPEATVAPLIHHRPETGLQAKFSLEYAAAAALLDRYPGFASFSDEAVRRQSARRLVDLVEIKLEPGGSWLLDGELQAEVHTRCGEIRRISQRFPPGSPARPASAAQLQAKLTDCVTGLGVDPGSWSWRNAAQVLREHC